MRHCIKAFMAAAAIFTAAVLACSCKKDNPKPAEGTSVLIYLAANNSLEYWAHDCIAQLAKGYLPEKGSKEQSVMVYLRDNSRNPKLLKLSRKPDGKMDTVTLCIYDPQQNSATAETLHKVLEDANCMCPAEHRGLVLWSHSTGYLPEGFYSDPDNYDEDDDDDDDFWSLAARKHKRTAFGSDDIDGNNFEIEIQDLAAALPCHYDYIIFDSCLMGGVEVAYELKDCCDYIAFSQSEIKSQGFPYYVTNKGKSFSMMEHIFSGESLEDALTAICKTYYEFYEDQPTSTSGGTISFVSTDGLENLATACKPIFEKYRTELKQLNPSNIQRYYRYGVHWFFDLDDIVKHVASQGEYAGFQSAMAGCVVYKAATDGFMTAQGGFLITNFSGLSTYLRYPNYPKLEQYYKKLKWNKATSYIE